MILGSNAASQILAAQQAGVMQNHAYAQSIAQPQMNPMGGMEASQMSAQSGMHMGFGMGAQAHHQAPALMRSASGAGQAGMFGLSMMAAFNYAPRQFDPFTTTIHNVSRGWAGGGLSGAIGAGAATIGTYLAIGSAASYMTRNIMMGAQQQVHAASTVQGGYGMSGMNMGQMNVPMANNLASQMMPTVDAAGRAGLGNLINAGSMTNIMGQGMASGAFRGVSSASQFKQVLNRLTGEALQMSQVLKSSIEDARGALDSMNREFGMGAGEAIGTIGGMGAMMGSTGMGMSAQMGLASYGAQVFRGMGQSRLQGARYGLGLGQKVGFAQTQGFLSQDMMRDVGGAQNFTSRLTQAGVRIFSGKAGMRLLGAMMDPEGGLDESMAQRIATGAVSKTEINKAYSANVKGKRGRGMLMQSRGDLISDFMSEYGTGGAVQGLGGYYGDRGDKDWMVQATSGLQGNEMDLLQGLEGANPVIKFRMKQAAQEGLQSGGLQGKSISQIVDAMVSKLVGPIRDKFRGWGRSISAGISEATDEIGRSLLGQGPAMHSPGLGRGAQTSVGFSTMMGTGHIANRQFSGAMATINAAQGGFQSFNQHTGGAFSFGGVMDNVYSGYGPEGAGGMGSMFQEGGMFGGEGITGELGMDIPFLSPGGMGGGLQGEGMQGFGTSWGYGTERGYGDLTSWGRKGPSGFAGLVNSFIPDAFRTAARGGDPWDSPKFGMTNAPGWNALTKLALVEGAPAGLGGAASRFSRFMQMRGTGAGSQLGLFGAQGKWGRAANRFGRIAQGGTFRSTLNAVGGLFNRASAAFAGTRGARAASAAGGFLFGPAEAGLRGHGVVRGLGKLVQGTGRLGGAALGGASRLAGRAFWPLMAVDAIINDYHYRGTAGLRDVEGGISGDNADWVMGMAGSGIGFGSGQSGLRGFETGSSMSADWDANSAWGFVGQSLFGGWWGEDAGGQLGNANRGLISEGYIPIMGQGRTRDGRTEDDLGFFAAWGGDDNQIYGKAVHKDTLRYWNRALSNLGQTSDIVRLLGDDERFAGAKAAIEGDQGERLRRGAQLVQKTLSEQIYNNRLLQRRQDQQTSSGDLGPGGNADLSNWLYLGATVDGRSESEHRLGSYEPKVSVSGKQFAPRGGRFGFDLSDLDPEGSRPSQTFKRIGMGRHGFVTPYATPTDVTGEMYGYEGEGGLQPGATTAMLRQFADTSIRRRMGKHMTDAVLVNQIMSKSMGNQGDMRDSMESLTTQLASYYAFGFGAQLSRSNATSEEDISASQLLLDTLGIDMSSPVWEQGPFGIPSTKPGGANQVWDINEWNKVQSVMASYDPEGGFAGLKGSRPGAARGAKGWYKGMTAKNFKGFMERTWQRTNAHLNKAATGSGSGGKASWEHSGSGKSRSDISGRVSTYMPKGSDAGLEETLAGVMKDWLSVRTPHELSTIVDGSFSVGSTIHNDLMKTVRAESGLSAGAAGRLFAPNTDVVKELTSITKANAHLMILGQFNADENANAKRRSTRYGAYQRWKAATGEASAGKTVGVMAYSQSADIGKLVDELLEADGADGSSGDAEAIVARIMGVSSDMSDEGLLETGKFLIGLGRQLDNPYLEMAGFKAQNHGAFKRVNRRVEKKYGEGSARLMPLKTKLKEAWEAFGSMKELRGVFGQGREGKVAYTHMRDVGYQPTELKSALERQFLPAWLSNKLGTRAEGLHHIETLLTATLDTDGSGLIQKGQGLYGLDSVDSEGTPISDIDSAGVADALFAVEQVSSLSRAGGAGGALGGKGAQEILELTGKLPGLNVAIDEFVEQLKKKPGP